jgi:peroxiredoxin
MTVKPREPAPPLDVALVGGGRFVLSANTGKAWTLVLFYRGLHCERCKGYLGEIERMLPDFAKRGVDVVAVSSDTLDRAQKSATDWKLPTLKVGYEFAIDVARKWGLFISRAVRDDETPIFAEPATFLIDREGRIYFAVINSITRMRPYPKDILETVDRILETGAPARGEA